MRDELSGDEATLDPRVLVNATGGWIDLTNAALGAETRSINGVKGSHLVIDDADLLADLDGRMVYFENSDQRICIVFPWQGKVLAGSTEVPLADPDIGGLYARGDALHPRLARANSSRGERSIRAPSCRRSQASDR